MAFDFSEDEEDSLTDSKYAKSGPNTETKESLS